MKNIFHKINAMLAETCGWFLLIIMSLLLIDIISRGLGKQIPGLTPIAVFVTLAVIYLGLARCEEYHEHVSVNVFLNLLSHKGLVVMNLIIYLVELLIIGLFVKEMINNFMMSYSTKEAISEVIVLLVWPSKLAMFIGLIFYWIQILLNFIEDFLKLKNKNYSTGIEEKKNNFNF